MGISTNTDTSVRQQAYHEPLKQTNILRSNRMLVGDVLQSLGYVVANIVLVLTNIADLVEVHTAIVS